MPAILLDLLDIIFAIALALFIRFFILMPVRVQGNSMNNTLKNGEFMLCFRFLYRKRMRRGDIVICRYPGRTHRLLGLFSVRTCFVKRLIALPGDVIEVRDGLFSVNGIPETLPPASASQPRYTQVFRKRNALPAPSMIDPPELIETPDASFRRIGSFDIYTRYTLKANECFVMGDHRAVSNDSRKIGPIPSDMILGRVVCVFFPFNRARRF